MMLEPAPVEGMPSFLELIKRSRRGLNNMMPRWWIACDYDPVRQTEDGLAWEIRGRGVKVMTEDEIISAQGNVQGSGKVNPVAQQWADSMTDRYEELARADTVFGQLRNVMDLSSGGGDHRAQRFARRGGLPVGNALRRQQRGHD